MLVVVTMLLGKGKKKREKERARFKAFTADKVIFDFKVKKREPMIGRREEVTNLIDSSL